MTWQIQLQITVERPADGEAAARMLRGWFAGSFEAMGGRLRTELLAAEPPPADFLRKRRRADSFGRPGDVWGQVSTGVEGARGLRMSEKPFSPASWKAFLDGMSKTPHLAVLYLVTLDADGFPNAHPSFRVTAQVNADFNDWLSLSVQFGPDLLDDPAFQRSTLDFVHGFADEWNVAYGEISYDRGSGRTAYEDVFGGNPNRTAPESRKFLRGYAWLTLCAQEIGDRLGGVEALRASDAFAAVEPLRNGGYWLLASQDWREFGQPAAEKMFPVLAPVLRPGESVPDAPDDPPYYVSRRDAAELQG
jgi:hypothetical protein